MPTYFSEKSEFCFLFPSEIDEQTQNIYIENFKNNNIFNNFTLIDTNKNFTNYEHDSIAYDYDLGKLEIINDYDENKKYEMKIEIAKDEKNMNLKYNTFVKKQRTDSNYSGVDFYGIVFTSPTKYTLHYECHNELKTILKDNDRPFDRKNIRKAFYLQSVIDKTIIKALIPSNSLPNIQDFHIYRKFLDREGYEINKKQNKLQDFIPLLMLFYFVPCINCLLNLLVMEKETKIKDSLVIIGLKRSMFWCSWIIIYGIIISISAILATMIMTFTSLYTYIHWSVLITTIFIYGLSCCCISFILSTLIEKSKAANITGVFIIVLLLAIYFSSKFLSDNSVIKLICNFVLSPFSFLSIYNKLNELEENEITTTFKTLVIDSSLIIPYIGLLVSFLIYFILAIYLDNVLPQGTSYHKKWNYLFTDVLKFFSHGTQKSDSITPIYVTNKNPFIEEESDILKKSVTVKNIGKTFKSKHSKTDILKNINFVAYRNEIFAILGHNGAGKTTLINIMTGIISASRGEIYFDDLSFNGNEIEICKQFGYCPQFDILNNNLTVSEHINLFAGIKNDKVDVDKVLEEIDLLEMKDVFPDKLSGGQKRKLCISLSLIGSPKYIFLDEPTTGLDPYSRKSIWKMLRKKKNNCTIFITTHYMDEADLLADRKMIISNGEIACLGSSLFLKGCFDMNYTLDIFVQDYKDITLLDNTINYYCPDDSKSKIITPTNVNNNNTISENSNDILQVEYIITYLIPIKCSSKFSYIFEDLNKIVKDDGNTVKNFSLASPTLEELFIKLEGNNPKFDASNVNTSNVNNTNLNYNIENNVQNNDTVNEYENKNNDNFFINGDQLLIPKNITSVEINKEILTNNLTTTYGKLFNKIKQFYLIPIYEIVKVRLTLFFRNKTFLLLYLILPILIIIFSIYILNNSIDNDNMRSNIITFESLAISPDIYENGQWFKDIPGSNSQALEVIDKIGNNPKLTTTSLNYTKELVIDTGKVFPNTLNYIGGFTGKTNIASDLQFTIYTNHTYTYSAPIAINIIDNAILNFYNINNTISTTYQPLDWVLTFDYDKDDKEMVISLTNEIDRQNQESLLILIIGIVITLSISIYGPYMVKEREEGITYQLFLKGTNRLVYWLSILISDSICILILVTFIGIICCISNISVFNIQTIDYVIIITVLWTVGSLLHQYIIGYFFKKYEKISSFLIIINPILTLVIGFYGFSICKSIKKLTDEEFYNINQQNIRNVYLYDIYVVLIIFIPAAILLIYLKIWTSIFHLKFSIKEGEIEKFLNLPESVEILAKNELSHNEKSIIISKMFFNSKMPYSSELIKQKEHFVPILIGTILIIILFSLFLIIMEKYTMKRIRKSTEYTSEERKIKNTKLKNGSADVYNEWKRVKNALNCDQCKLINSKKNKIDNKNNNIICSIGNDSNDVNINNPYNNQNKILNDNKSFNACNDKVALKIFQITKDFSVNSYKMKKIKERKENENNRFTNEYQWDYQINKNNQNNHQKYDNKYLSNIILNEDDSKYTNLDIHNIDDRNDNESYLEIKDNRVNCSPKNKKYITRIVDDVTLGVNAGECLGLLGPNGAGKTTSISMITGLISCTHGMIVYGDQNLHKTRLGNLSLGYCPQYNSLWELLTVKETIQFYLKLYGYPRKNIDSCIKSLLNICGIENHANKKINEISGGTKRKISLIISICSSPKYLILDEPTAGMDPFTRRYIWKLINDLKKNIETTTILTTHSTEEAEALCDRLAILIKGRLVCVDTPKRIKMKQNDKYVLEVFTNNPDIFEQQIVKENNIFGLDNKDYKVESSLSYQKYSVKMKNENIANVFTMMEDSVKNGLVSRYNFGQFSLEESFINFINNS